MIHSKWILSLSLSASLLARAIAAPVDQPIRNCNVKPLPPVHPGVADDYERAAPGTHPESIRRLDQGLIGEIDNLKQTLSGRTITIESGYRPGEYQKHLHEISVTWFYLSEAYLHDHDGVQKTACADLQRVVDNEIDKKHGLFRAPVDKFKNGYLTFRKGQPMVNPDGRSAHELPVSPAVDLKVKPAVPRDFIEVARKAGLYHPCPEDKVHFTLTPDIPCELHMRTNGNSPIRILVTDPLGRRVGFDSVLGAAVNEIGDGTFYSGEDAPAQVVDISNAVAGAYRIGGVGTAEGPYSISVITFRESGRIISTDAWGGATRDGNALPEHSFLTQPPRTPRPRPRLARDNAPISQLATTVSDGNVPPCNDPAVVTAPPVISLRQTGLGGVRVSGSPVLQRFLTGAAVRIVCGPSTSSRAATPTIGNVEIGPETVFPIGTTTVTFAFIDGLGTAGRAVSTVTVTGLALRTILAMVALFAAVIAIFWFIASRSRESGYEQKESP